MDKTTPENALAELWKQKRREFIEKHITSAYATLEANSIQYFLKEGLVSGSFERRLNDLMDEVKKFVLPQPSVAPLSGVEEAAEKLAEAMQHLFDMRKLKGAATVKNNAWNICAFRLADYNKASQATPYPLRDDLCNVLENEILQSKTALEQPNASKDNYRCYYEGRIALAESLYTLFTNKKTK